MQGEEEEASVAMQPLHPNQRKLLRIRIAFLAGLVLLAALSADPALARAAGLPRGLAPGALALAGLIALLFLPERRYRAWAWGEGEEELHVRHGLLVRTLTIIPYSRVQHIDLSQGPIERRYGLSRLILHSAGTRGASVLLPGLAQKEAERLRDLIRSRIRQEPP